VADRESAENSLHDTECATLKCMVALGRRRRKGTEVTGL